MSCFKAILSGLAAILVATLLPGGGIYYALSGYRAPLEQKAIGMAAVSGGFHQSLLSPWFWILAALIFVLFLAASRFAGKTSRVIFFWIPTVMISVLGVAISGLLAYMFLFLESRANT